MSKSIKTNYIYTVANTVLGLVFPLITYPYVSRVLQPDGLGLYNFYNAILAYVSMFANLGVTIYATRLIARHRDDSREYSRMTVEIVIMNIVTMLIAYMSIFVLDAFVMRIHENRILFYVMSLSVILGPFSVNWFFQAIEDFRYITIRSLIIKLLSLILLITFVRSKDDLIVYAFVLVLATVGNNVFNFVHLKKYISFRDIKFKELRVFRHLKPCLVLFVMNIVISIYLNIDSIMLGFMKTDADVGYYSVSVKLSHIVLSLITCIGVVLMPRLSYLIESGNDSEFKRLAGKSMEFVVGLSLPMVTGLMFVAAPVILLLFGEQYAESVSVLQIIAPIILFAGMTNVLGIQILYPKGQEKLVIFSTLAAAIVNVILNYILIPKYSYDGAAFASVMAEFVVFVLQIILGRKYYPQGLFSWRLLDYVFAVILMCAALYVVSLFKLSLWLNLFISISVSVFVYFFYLYVRKNELLLDSVAFIKKRFNG